MNTINDQTFPRVPPITFDCKYPDCKGHTTYNPYQVIIAKAVGQRNKRILVKPPLGIMYQGSASCDTLQHWRQYNIIYFKCKKCDELVMGTDEDKCTDKSRIFNANKSAELTCINGHKNEYSLP